MLGTLYAPPVDVVGVTPMPRKSDGAKMNHPVGYYRVRGAYWNSTAGGKSPR